MAYDDPRHDTITTTVGKIVDDVRDLFREEVALARAEIRQEISAFSAIAASFAVGAGAALFALSFLLLGIAQAAARLIGWPAWTGYIGMAIVLGIIAAITIQSARRRARTVSAVPEQTVATIKETKEWIQDRMSSARR